MNQRSKRSWPLVAVAVLFALPAMAGHPFLTPQPPFITLDLGVPAGSMVQAILSSGESYHGFLFEGIPDGIGLAPGSAPGTVDVFVNHEQTHVPFFGTADFQDASVSRLTLDISTGAVVDASVALPPDAGFIRFCSAFMAGPGEGFAHYTFFTGEEANDVVGVPVGATYGADPALGSERQAGYAVILDAMGGGFTQVAGLGRYNHENTIVVPGGWSRLALLSTDDTFNAPSSQLYLYLANHESHIWQDKGSLWAFRVTRTDDGPVNPNDPFNGANDYLDLQPGDVWRGEFIRVPKKIARGQTGLSPQDALERWSNEHNVFQFIRLEDLAYDRNHPRTVYLADTGQTRIVPDPETGRLMRIPSGSGLANNGRIFEMVFDEKNPRKVDRFSVFADGDSPGAAEFVPMRNPDNMDTSHNSLMVQEDTNGARIWRYDFGTETWRVVATVNDPVGESSGIVDASDWFGPGWWMLDVQAHGTFIDTQFVDGVTLKRESGQLLRLKIPGS